MLTGSCLCGSIAYEVDAPPGWIAHCHCKTCRKAHGTAFTSVMMVPRSSFRWIRGEEFLSSFESSPGNFRQFCSRCGSQLVSDRNGQHDVMLRLGSLDTPTTDRAKCHIRTRPPGMTRRTLFPNWPRAFPISGCILSGTEAHRNKPAQHLMVLEWERKEIC